MMGNDGIKAFIAPLAAADDETLLRVMRDLIATVLDG
jgi:hypothetical protein